MPRRSYVEHGLEYIAFDVQKYIAHLAASSGPPASTRRAARGARICETCLLLLNLVCCTGPGNDLESKEGALSSSGVSRIGTREFYEIQVTPWVNVSSQTD